VEEEKVISESALPEVGYVQSLIRNCETIRNECKEGSLLVTVNDKCDFALKKLNKMTTGIRDEMNEYLTQSIDTKRIDYSAPTLEEYYAPGESTPIVEELF